ncbi:glycosyltransferase [Microbacterium sp. NPDC055357]
MAYAAGTGFRFPVDQTVPASTYLMSRRWQERQRADVAERFTHVIVEAGRHLFGDVYHESVAAEIRWLQARGVRVAMLTHGSDMRAPEVHARTHEFSPFVTGEWAMTPRLIEETARNRALLNDVKIPAFASTPGMLIDVPEGRWLPVVIEPSRWNSGRVSHSEVPLVVHAPSNPWIKGTAMVEPVLRMLAAEGVIRYERIEGIPSAEMPARIHRADIVLDQVRIGDYGVAACEAMAAGRIVLGNIDDQVRAHVRGATGRELPVVQADPHTLEDVLRAIAASPEPFRAAAVAGVDFVSAVHDGRMSAEVLSEFLGSDSATSPR